MSAGRDGLKHVVVGPRTDDFACHMQKNNPVMGVRSPAPQCYV